MNKIFTFLTAPVTAFFYPPVYQDAAKSSVGRGVLYSLYLAGLSVVLVMMVLSARVMPRVDAFIDWTKLNMPAMVWTPEGLSLENGQTSAVLTHPRLGTIISFDMTKTNVTEADMGKAYVMVTAKKIFLRRAPGQIEGRDITGAGMRSSQQLPPRVRINGDIVVKMYQNIKGAMAFVMPFLMIIFFFMFFLVANLFYSLVGLLFNLMRSERLRYGAIFNLTCFATTAAFTLTWLRVLIPLRALNWPLVLNVVINLVFMFFAFKVTDKKKETV
ncbi:MAG: DUF1189 family protein [Candidatus Omnitrophota bacterium]